MSEERRQDYPKIIEKLEDIRVEMSKVATKVEERNESALIWRGDVCRKFERIFQWLDKLPCKEREERSKSQKIFDGLLWGGLGITFGILIVHLGWK